MVAGGGWYEPLLDLLPSPLLLIEPGSGCVFFANRAAHEVAGGVFPMDLEAPEHRRVAAGERFTNLRVDWQTPTAPARSWPRARRPPLEGRRSGC